MIVFIIGTDTDVGKTHYGLELARNGKRVIKPIETGKNSFVNIEESDCYQYAKIRGVDISQINKYFFTVPASPHFAAEMDNTIIEVAQVKKFIKQIEMKNSDDLFVELAGGLLVPITRDYWQLNLIEDMSLVSDVSVDIVVANKLGCVNHAALTIKMLQGKNIKIRKVIINNMGKEETDLMKDNRRVIETLTI